MPLPLLLDTVACARARSSFIALTGQQGLRLSLRVHSYIERNPRLRDTP